jgi:putative endonuclease
MDRRRVGLEAEGAVARWLVAHGYSLIDRNVRLQRGELDLIAARDGALWFIESKCRTRSDVGPPHRAVDARKRRALYAAALEYRWRRRLRGPFGFLVASVVWAGGRGSPIITVARLPVGLPRDGAPR